MDFYLQSKNTAIVFEIGNNVEIDLEKKEVSYVLCTVDIDSNEKPLFITKDNLKSFKRLKEIIFNKDFSCYIIERIWHSESGNFTFVNLTPNEFIKRIEDLNKGYPSNNLDYLDEDGFQWKNVMDLYD